MSLAPYSVLFMSLLISSARADNIDFATPVRTGLEEVSYINPEFTVDGRYMVWFEPLGPFENGDRIGTLWHCGVDQETGDLHPPSGRGFPAFESTIYKRANPGYDAEGPYYVGATPDGHLKMVRPTGPSTGVVTDITYPGIPPDPDRRGIFPSIIPGSSERYAFWFKAEPGPSPPAAEWVEVRLIDLDNPVNEIVIDRQENAFPGSTWTPVDLAVPRWMRGLPVFVFGFEDESGHIQARLASIEPGPQATTMAITAAGYDHFDPSPFFDGKDRYIFPGIDGKPEVRVYRQQEGEPDFSPWVDIRVVNSEMEIPCRALSNEPFLLGDKIVTSFHLSDCADGGSFFTARSEIWTAIIHEADAEPFLLAGEEGKTFNEPEFARIGEKAFIYYTGYPAGSNPFTVTYELWRVEVLLIPSYEGWTVY